MATRVDPVGWNTSLKTTTGTIKTGSGVLHGFFVNTAIATGAVTVADGVGTVLVLAVGLAAGSYVVGLDLNFATSLTATFAGTGSVTFLYR